MSGTDFATDPEDTDPDTDSSCTTCSVLAEMIMRIPGGDRKLLGIFLTVCNEDNLSHETL